MQAVAEGVAAVPAEALVVFTPSGRRGRFPVGMPLLQAARSLGVDIDSVCGGRALCGRCQILLSEGEFAKHGVTSRADHLSGESDDEREFVAQGGTLADGRRLACSTLIQGDVVIDVPADSQFTDKSFVSGRKSSTSISTHRFGCITWKSKSQICTTRLAICVGLTKRLNSNGV